MVIRHVYWLCIALLFFFGQVTVLPFAKAQNATAPSIGGASPLERLKQSGVPEVVAIIVSLSALYLSIVTQRREMRKLREEQKLRQRAEIRARLGPPESTTKYTKYSLLVENFAQAAAEDLTILFDEAPALEHDCVRGTKPFIPARLPGRDDFELDLYFRNDPDKGILGADPDPQRRPHLLAIRWADLSGAAGEYQKGLRFPGLPMGLDLEALRKGQS